MVHAISEAFGEVQALSDEMQEAFDGTPEPFRESSGASREAAASALAAACSYPFVPKMVGDIQVSWIEMHKGKDGKLFRSARRDNIVRCLRSCLAKLPVHPDEDTSQLKQELQTAITILGNVYFPGMSGR